MKVVINRQAGGFGLSEAAYKKLGLEWDGYGHGFIYGNPHHGVDAPDYYLMRTDAKLVECVEELGVAANGRNARLEIVDIPDNVEKWTITSHHGIESIVEVTGRVWTAPHGNFIAEKGGATNGNSNQNHPAQGSGGTGSL